MVRLLGWLPVGAMALTLGASGLFAQGEYVNNFKYNTGQSVQPVFEGWSHAPDGSINMHFGYLNRNYVEQLTIPVGPSNSIEPGGPDRGQPTFFYTRTHRNLFTVNIPKDWDKKRELVWTVTVNGKTERAVGWLQVEWEIDPVGGAGGGGGNTDPERLANKAPTIVVAPVAAVKLPATGALSATITDDGLPKPRPRAKPAVGQETPPTLQGGPDAPVNVPVINAPAARETPPGATPAPGSAAAAGGAAAPPRPLQVLSVSWTVWRGPADATFSPASAQPKDGKTLTTATFTKPGEYVLRGVATDTYKTSSADVKVTVE
jgi:hypothetical protein